MTTASAPQLTVPALTLGWRLNMALRHADVSVQQMANELGMARSTLSRWLNDRGAAPRPVFVKQWALRTGVPVEWLLDGADTDTPTGAPTPSKVPGSYGTVGSNVVVGTFGRSGADVPLVDAPNRGTERHAA